MIHYIREFTKIGQIVIKRSVYRFCPVLFFHAKFQANNLFHVSKKGGG